MDEIIVVKSILPILQTGKRTTEESLADRVKFKKFIAHTHTPRHRGIPMLFNPRSLGDERGAARFSRMIKAAIPVNTAAKRSEYTKKKGSSSWKAEY